jgi:hypothetical protein
MIIKSFFSSPRLILLFSLAVILLFPNQPLLSQSFYFGKNKIQYVDFDWHLLKGEHVDIYFYPEEREIAEIALDEAEASYLYLEEKFRHHVFRRIPLILYSSHQDFEQTNVIPFFVPEGVGGVTEFLKGRVALPFNGSYHDFRKVIRHEMVHVFQLSKLSHAHAINRRYQATHPPLWLTEGLAEFWSGEWDKLGDQVMRDLVLNDKLVGIKDLWRFNGTFALYKIGESIFHFLEERYGDESFSLLYEEMGRGRTFNQAFERTFGLPLKTASEEWMWSMKTRYYPEVKYLTDVNVLAERITKEGPNFNPVIYRDSDGVDQCVYLSTRTGYANICSKPLDGLGGERTILKGGRGALFESLHPFVSEIDVNSGGQVVFSTKYHDRDALVILDAEDGKILNRFQFDDLVGIISPSWSPGGDRIVFSGLAASGYLDLYILHPANGRLERLTNDRFSDQNPDFSPSGDRVVFSSDRTPYGPEGFRNLFIFDLDSGTINYLTSGRWNDDSPSWRRGGNGEILFVSDRDEVRNAYIIDEGGAGERLTSFSSGIYAPRRLPEGDGIVFAAMDNQNFYIYRFEGLGVDDTLGFLHTEEQVRPSWEWELPDRDSIQVERVEKYSRDFSLDIAEGGVGFSSDFGSSQGALLMLSDLMGDQLIAFQIYNNASSTSDFLSSFSGSATYINRKKRLNYGMGAYHFKGDFFDLRYSDSPFTERQFGTFFLLGYPFSKFLRLESMLFLSHSQREDFVTDFSRDSYLVSNVFSLIKDNSLWLPTGPIDGERINITLGITNDLTRAQTDNATFQVDFRKYFRTSLLTSYAVRVLGRISEGTLPERMYIGGSWTLRGYPRYSILGTRVLLLNQEWRFPLLHRLIFRFPFGDMAFPPFQGALFFDVGNAWDKGDDFDDFLGSFGLGVRFSLGGPLVLRFDFSRTTDFHTVSKDTKVDFFFGYNY